MAKTKKAAPAIDPLVASLMPESDKKMGAIAGISLVVALAICLWASMYEQVWMKSCSMTPQLLILLLL